ncbi:PQQ-binding-like beta-propeller repeat protein [Streptosporangium sp. NPDC000396]|uniref:outer membrane protein assembly factor BamB family protein n=1 Tax=Streptosporangium sp. NPDC000396 TaxID=3366185 RepID=UPI0036A67146
MTRRILAVIVILLPLGVLPADLAATSLSRLGSFLPVWKIHTNAPENEDGPPLPYVVTDDLVLSAERRSGDITLRELRSGRIRTVLPGPAGRRLEAAWLSGNLAITQRSRERRGVTTQHLSAYDTGSGGELWDIDASAVFAKETGSSPADLEIHAAARGIALVSREAATAMGVRLRDGGVAWRNRLPGGPRDTCDGIVKTGPAALVLLRRCEHGVTSLWAFDLATGLTRWHHELPVPGERATGEEEPGQPDGETGVEVGMEVGTDGTVLASTGLFHAIYSPAGRRIGPVRRGSAYHLGVTEKGIAYTTGSDIDPSEATAVAVDRDGEVLWRRERPPLEPYGITRDDGSRLIVAKTDDDESRHRLRPAVLMVMDIGNGVFAERPLPTSDSSTTLIGAGADLVLVRHLEPGGDGVTAYRLSRTAGTGSPALGGVSPSAWPDACGLLGVEDLQVLGAGYTAHPRYRRIAGTPLPRPSACDLVPPTDDGDAVSVTVAWVAPSPAIARSLLATELASRSANARPVERRAADVWQIEGRGLAPPLDSALILVGNVIVHLTVFNDPPAVPKVAGSVTRNLRRAHG